MRTDAFAPGANARRNEGATPANRKVTPEGCRVFAYGEDSPACGGGMRTDAFAPSANARQNGGPPQPTEKPPRRVSRVFACGEDSPAYGGGMRTDAFAPGANARQNGGPPSQQKSHPGGLPGIRLRRRFPRLRRGNANRRICAQRKCPAERWTTPANRKATLRGGFSVGWGGRIRTDGCGSQSPVPYRLATPQNYRLL